MSRILISLVLLLFANSLIYAQEHTLPAEVFEVKTFGYWETEEQNGQFRIVIKNSGHEHVASKVYLEWISDELDERQIINSVPISEINNQRLYSVGIEKINGNKVILGLTHTYSNEESLLEITPKELGKYSAVAV